MRYSDTSEQFLQHLVDEVLYHLYQLPKYRRTALSVLQLIGAYQKKVEHSGTWLNGCESITFAQVIDHFLKQLPEHQDETRWFCDKWSVFDKSIEKSYTLTHTLIQTTANRVQFKKYMVDCNQKELEEFYTSASVCSQHMYEGKKTIVEYVDLTTGEQKLLKAS
ncbi:hypothetical protein [Thalassobacillus hwangdonensis]|uniref:Uncharacterized protein n=1 Tax=Thalassobacillus hwangdonensis TaxID=546108 RepID=A0ABW3L686_9BACI